MGDREVITLHCVRQGSKLRIRFHSFTNAAGKIYSNVYNNSYNCQFPRDIRREGRYYQIGHEDLQLVAGGSRTPFYRISKNNIRILPRGPDDRLVEEAPPSEIIDPTPTGKGKGKGTKKKASPVADRVEEVVERPTTVFEVTECVICMSSVPDTIFLPCAHLCTCLGCYTDMRKMARPMCPLCRRTIYNVIPN